MGWYFGKRSSGKQSSTESATAASVWRRPVMETVEPRVLMTTVHYSTHFADGNFLPNNWSIVMSNVGGGGTQSASRAATGGHPGAYRVVDNTVFGASGGSADYGFNAYRLGKYNPATKGAITSIAYGEDSKLISGFGEGQATGAALIQNGVVYFATGLVTAKTTWQHQVRANLTAANFTATDLKSHPDFSQTAAPIQFGFYRANSAGGSGYTIIAGIDNFSMTIKSTRVISLKKK